MMPLDYEDAARYIKEKLRSREWWLLAPLDDNGNNFCGHIEQEFYSGEANADFHLVMAPELPLFAFYLARKSRMSAGDLAGLMISLSSGMDRETVEQYLEQRDLVLLGSGEDSAGVASAFLGWFQTKFGGDIGP